MKTFTTLALFGVAAAIRLSEDGPSGPGPKGPQGPKEGPAPCEGGECECPFDREVSWDDAREWVDGAIGHLKEAVGNGVTAGDIMGCVDTNGDGKLCLMEGSAALAEAGLHPEDVEFLGGLMDTDGSGDIDGDELQGAMDWALAATEEDLDGLVDQYMEDVHGEREVDWDDAREWIGCAAGHIKGAVEEGLTGACVIGMVDHNGDGRVCAMEGLVAGEMLGLEPEDVEFIGGLVDKDGSGDLDEAEVDGALEWVAGATEEDLDGLTDMYMEEVHGWRDVDWDDAREWVEEAAGHIRDAAAAGMTVDCAMGMMDTDGSGDICMGEGVAVGEMLGLHPEDVEFLGGLMDTDGSGRVDRAELEGALTWVIEASDEDLDGLVDKYMADVHGWTDKEEEEERDVSWDEARAWIADAARHIKEGAAAGYTAEDVMGMIDTDGNGKVCMKEGLSLGEGCDLEAEDVEFIGGLVDTDESGDVDL